MLSSEAMAASYGAPLPDLLRQLLAFQVVDAAPYNEGFELAEVDATELLPEPPPHDGRRILPFGVNGMGSVFATWLAPGEDPAAAPVVYLDADAADDMVVARNLREFLGLLGLDQEDPPLFVGPIDYEELLVERGWSYSPRWSELQRWLKDRRIAVPRHPQRVMERAAEACPGFRAWMGHEDEELPPVLPSELHRNLHEAVELGDRAGILACLAHSLDLAGADVRDAASWAIVRGRQASLEALLEGGLPVDTRLAHDNTLLLHAALHGRLSIVDRLLARGADPDARNELGETAELLADDNSEEVAAAVKARLAAARHPAGGGTARHPAGGGTARG